MPPRIPKIEKAEQVDTLDDFVEQDDAPNAESSTFNGYVDSDLIDELDSIEVDLQVTEETQEIERRLAEIIADNPDAENAEEYLIHTEHIQYFRCIGWNLDRAGFTKLNAGTLNLYREINNVRSVLSLQKRAGRESDRKHLREQLEESEQTLQEREPEILEQMRKLNEELSLLRSKPEAYRSRLKTAEEAAEELKNHLPEEVRNKLKIATTRLSKSKFYKKLTEVSTRVRYLQGVISNGETFKLENLDAYKHYKSTDRDDPLMANIHFQYGASIDNFNREYKKYFDQCREELAKITPQYEALKRLYDEKSAAIERLREFYVR